MNCSVCSEFRMYSRLIMVPHSTVMISTNTQNMSVSTIGASHLSGHVPNLKWNVSWPTQTRLYRLPWLKRKHGNRSYIHSYVATVQLHIPLLAVRHMNCYSAGPCMLSCLSFQIFPLKISPCVGGISRRNALRKTTVTPDVMSKPLTFNLETLCW